MNRIIKMSIIAGIAVIMLTIAYSLRSIYYRMDHIVRIATAEFSSHAPASLISLIESDEFGFKEKNDAIWALGQLADSTALPFLEDLNMKTAESAQCNLEMALCKREIQKSIAWCSKGNVTSWMYGKMRKF